MSESQLLEQLKQRATHQCELCGHAELLAVYQVEPFEDFNIEQSVLVCGQCLPQLIDETPLVEKHWFCLRESIWSQHAPVQVVSWRMLHRLKTYDWAQDLLEQAYLDEETMNWAKSTVVNEDEDVAPTMDSNNTQIFEGDSVTLIKDLNVKGTSFTAKRGTMVKNVRLTDNPEHVDGRINGMTIVLKTCFLKKA